MSDEPTSDRDDGHLSFEALHREYQDRVHALVLRLVENVDEAEDLTVETFVRAYRGWAGRDQAKQPYVWLHQIVLKVCKNHYRRRHELGATAPDKRLAPSGGIGQVLDLRLKAAIDSLAPEYRDVLLLRERDDLPFEEISRRLNISLAVVKTRLHRARQKVEQFLGESSVTDWKVWQNPQIARRFSDRRRGGLLGGDVQMETLLRLVAAAPAVADSVGGNFAVLDLGCGDGVLLETVLAAYPAAVRGVALDGSPAMLERAEARLAGRPSVAFVSGDFNDSAWQNVLPSRSFEVIVSGFAIHHSEDERKRELFGEIFDLLAPGGVFVNVEHVASATPLGEQLWEAAWVENVVRFRREQQGEEADYADALHEFRTRPDKAANRLAPVEAQLGWLREIGFEHVDCYWKHFELAVLAGYKPAKERA